MSVLGHGFAKASIPARQHTARMGLLNGNLAALRIVARELDLGAPIPETFGRSTTAMLGGWLVVRDGMIDESCTARVVQLINERMNALYKDGQWGAIGALYYAGAVLVRGEA